LKLKLGCEASPVVAPRDSEHGYAVKVEVVDTSNKPVEGAKGHSALDAPKATTNRTGILLILEC